MSHISPLLTFRPALALATALVVLGTAAGAQAFRAESLIQPPHSGVFLTEGATNDPGVVALLSGLAKIESDLQLGMLYLQNGMTNPDGSHFAHPRAETYPGIKDQLAKAGVTDFEAQLIALETAGDSKAVKAAYIDAISAVMQARSVLQASPRDRLHSVIEQTRAVVAEINPGGATDVQNYQDAWAMLMVARNEIDLLTRGQDAAIVDAAKKMALAFDDIIITMPDPVASGPVTFDPAPLLQAIGQLETLAGSV